MWSQGHIFLTLFIFTGNHCNILFSVEIFEISKHIWEFDLYILDERVVCGLRDTYFWRYLCSLGIIAIFYYVLKVSSYFGKQFDNLILTFLTKVVCGLRETYVFTGYMLLKSPRNAIQSYQVICIVFLFMIYGNAKKCKGERESSKRCNWDLATKEQNPKRKPSATRITTCWN